MEIMKFTVLTLFPELFEMYLSQTIIQRAENIGMVSYDVVNIRDYSRNKHNQMDDIPFGGGAGMVLMIEPIDKCISALKAERDYDEVIFLTPDGDTLQQKMANQLSLAENIIILCGHFKGVDQRVRDHFITKEISIGDYVLSGGELGAAVLCDAI